MTLTFGVPDSETYLILDGLDYEGLRTSDWNQPDATTLSVYGNGVKNISYLNHRHSFYAGIHDYLVNAGYSSEGLQTITVVFQQAGRYSFDNCSVVSQPVETSAVMWNRGDRTAWRMWKSERTGFPGK